MPLYEYHCPHCEITFERLRPMSQADAPAACPQCQSEDTRRAISLFASFSKSSDGSVGRAGGGACASCASHACATCGR